jgi:hypothetical protein
MATAEESKASNIEKMGRELGEQYSELWQDIAHLHMKWGEYVVLFGTKPSRIDLINRAAPAFFGMFEREMWKNILLHLARLTDPPESFRSKQKKNLTLQNLPNLVENNALKERLDALLKEAEKRTKFCRDWRNRAIAHRDLDLALDRPSVALQNGSRKDVNDALDTIVETLNEVSAYYLDSESHFKAAGWIGGAEGLLYIIDDGQRRVA